MKLIVGLGNPGAQYENTRHNVGYLVVDALVARKLPKGIVVRKTNVFMNESGPEVKKLVKSNNLKIEDFYVIHDDLDIPLGQFKIQKGKGPKVHNGINSVDASLGTRDYWRVRIGIENRDPQNRVSGEKYTLEDFTPEEVETIKSVIDNVAERLRNE